MLDTGCGMNRQLLFLSRIQHPVSSIVPLSTGTLTNGNVF